LQKGEGLLHEGVAFGRFLTVREQPDGRVPYPRDTLGVDGAHLRELHQVRRAWIGHRTHVQHQGVPLHRGDVASDGRAVYAANASQLEEGASHHRAAVASGRHCLGTPLANRLQGHGNRRLRLAAHGLRRRVIHGDNIWRVDDLDIQPSGVVRC
jgi:hypothetical protein